MPLPLRLWLVRSRRLFGSVRLIASMTLLLLFAGCQTGASSSAAVENAHAPHVQLWGPPDNSGGGSGGGGGGM